MRTAGQRPGSRPVGEGRPPKGKGPAWVPSLGCGEKIPRTVTIRGALSICRPVREGGKFSSIAGAPEGSAFFALDGIYLASKERG